MVTLHVILLIRDLDQFHSFVDGILTPLAAGRDMAEDVFGGLNAALKLSWPAGGTKVSYLIIKRG